MNDKTQGINIGLQLANNGYTGDSYTINQMVKMAKRLHGYYVHSCNGYNAEKYDRLADKLENNIKDLAQGVGLHVYFQTDPRGGTLYVSSSKALNQSNYTRDGVYLE
jgi:hypothetical protein